MKQIAHLAAVLLWAIAYAAKKAFGVEIQPSALIGVGGVLLALSMRLPPLDGAWKRRLADAFLVLSAVVAVAFQSAPEWAADVLRYQPVVAEVFPVEVPAALDEAPAAEALDVFDVAVDGYSGPDVSEPAPEPDSINELARP